MPLFAQAPLGGGVGRLKFRTLREEVHRSDGFIIQVARFFRSDIAAAELCIERLAKYMTASQCSQMRQPVYLLHRLSDPAFAVIPG